MNLSLFDDLLDAVFIYNQDKEIIYCNEACATMLQVSLRRLKPGKPVYQFLQFEDTSIFFMEGGTLGKEEPMMYREIPYTTKSGNSATGLINIKKLEEQIDGNNAWMATVRDMSLEIQLHKKHHQQLAELEKQNKELQSAKEKLEDYNQNLEQMVAERTEELRKAHSFLDTMINSLDQGLMVFGPDNICLPVYTKVCEDIFGIVPAEKPIWEIYDLNEEQKSAFLKWSGVVFSEMLPFKDTIQLGVTSLSNHDQYDYNDPNFRFISMDYFPMRDDEGKLVAVVTVATDKTDEVRAKKNIEEKEAYVSMVTKILAGKDQFMAFVKDSKTILQELHKSLDDEKEVFNYPAIMRLFHSIKGSAGLYSIRPVVEIAHEFETELSPYKDKNNDERTEYHPTLKSNVEHLEETLNLVFKECKFLLGDMMEDGEHRVEVKMKVLDLFYSHLSEITPPENIQDEYARIQEEFKEMFLKEPIIKYFNSYNDLVLDLAERLDKNITPIVFCNGDLKIKAENYTELFNVLVHLFRNCVDHGIESEHERTEKGKDPCGTIKVTFDIEQKETENFLSIIIEDDGKGIDPAKIREKLASLGQEQIANSKSDEEIIYHIFDSSFSTSENVSDISGRGVGMDAIKEVVTNMGGELKLESKINEGSRFSFYVPVLE